MSGFDQLHEKFRDMEQEIEELKEELQFLEEEREEEEDAVDDDLADVAEQLGIIVVPDMSRWALLLDIERAIENVKNIGH